MICTLGTQSILERVGHNPEVSGSCAILKKETECLKLHTQV